MHPPRIKSAPVGRTKSKKVTATKDIEEWVQGKEQENDTSKLHSGQLTENVTEERLLKSRLMELGKERFKILSKCDHEIQSFKDKQKRKGFRVRLPRPVSANNVFNRRVSISERRRSSYSSKTHDPNAAPLVLITPGVRARNVQFDDEPPKTDNVNKSPRLSYPRPRTVPAKGSRQQPDTILEEWKPLTMSNDWSRPSTAVGLTTNIRSRRTSLSSQKHNHMHSKHTENKRADLIVVSSEPRFTALESSLSKNYMPQCKVDIACIIESITSLNIPLRAGSKEAKKELENKIALFMEENNIVF